MTSSSGTDFPGFAAQWLLYGKLRHWRIPFSQEIAQGPGQGGGEERPRDSVEAHVAARLQLDAIDCPPIARAMNLGIVAAVAVGDAAGMGPLRRGNRIEENRDGACKYVF